MTDPPPTKLEKPAKGRRWPWIVLGSGGILLLAVGLLWQNRVRIVNGLLKQHAPQFPTTVGQVEWKDGGVELQDVRVRSATGEAEIIRLPRAHLSLHPGNRALGMLTLEQPTLHFGPEFWASLAANHSSADASPASPAVFGLEGLRIQNANVEMELPSGEKLHAHLDWEGGAMGLDAEGAVMAARQQFHLHKFSGTLGDSASTAEAEEVSIEFSIQAATRTLVVHRLTTSALSAHLAATLLTALAKPSSSPSTSARAPIERLEIEQAQFGPLRLTADHLPGRPELPAMQGQLTAAIHGFKTALGAKPEAGEISLELQQAILGNANQSPWLTLPALHLAAQANAAGLWKLSVLDLPATSFQLSAAQLEAFGSPLPLAIQGQLALHGEGVSYADGQWTSDQPLSLVWNDAQLRLGDQADHEVLHWKELQLAAKLSDLLAHRRLAKLHWVAPHFHLTAADIAAFPVSAAEPEPLPTTVPLRPPAWFGWTCDDLQVKDGIFAAQPFSPGQAAYSTHWEIAPSAGFLRLALADFVASTPDLPAAPPLVVAPRLEIEVEQATLWRERRIERVSLMGSRVRIGATTADAQLPMEETSSVPGLPTSLPGFNAETLLEPGDWHIGEVTIANTKIFLHHLVPDAPEIILPLALKSFRNVPLTLAGLQQSEQIERVELPLVYVPGVRAGTTVADLDTNFIHFSLAGLLRKEIAYLELVNPKIYAGDSLFHYVERLRSQANEPTPPELPKTTAEARALFASLISLLEESTPLSPLQPTWRISHVRAINGQIVTTVKDSPLVRVPPLPFGADSSLRDGQINAHLNVPPGLYKPLLGLDLVAAISEGSIVFNLPLKQKSNNLVQVFKADWLRYKQFRISNVALEVTYDQNGIYAKFWAKGYQGDLAGAFNLYLDDTLSWDFWLSGTGIETKELTETLTPAYFSMDGKLSGKIIAQGDRNSLYQATGEFKNLQSGRIKIIALDDVIQSFPTEWSDAQRAWTRKSVEVLRDFQYDACAGDLRFYGLEGNIHLKLQGPDGARNFDIFSHDRRLTLEPPSPKE